MPKLSSTPQMTIALPEAIDLVRFEKNLLQIGFFSAHDRRSKDSDLSRKIEQWVNRDGKKMKVSAEFRSTLGLPSTADRDKYMAFMKIAMERKLAEGQLKNPIRFSGYSMLKVLGLSDSGANYEDLNQWGMRMADTTITSEQIIYSSSRKRFMNKTVHVFRSFTRVGESDLNGEQQAVQFAVGLEDWLLENLNQSYVVPEDFTQYRKLVRPTAKGIFVYLYVWFYASRGKGVEKDYAELCALLNVRCYQHASKIKETMGLSLDDLVNIGYLQAWDIQPMTSKKGFKLVLSPGRMILNVIANTQRRQMAFSAARPEITVEEQVVEAALLARGVESSKAAIMCRTYEPKTVLEQVEFLDAELERDKGRRIQNAAGFIIAFIEGQKAVPCTFESAQKRMERRAALQEESEAQKAKDESDRAEADLREQYAVWRTAIANDTIEDAYTEVALQKRFKAMQKEVSKDSQMRSYMDRLTPLQRRDVLMGLLRKEVAKELSLMSFEEWVKVNTQQELFSR